MKPLRIEKPKVWREDVWPVSDQPALHGVLVKIRDLGMCLISVRRLGPGEAGATTPEGSRR